MSPRIATRHTPIEFDASGVFRLIGREYTTLMEVIAEAFQNALDANAHEIKILIDERRRTVSIMDNGEGASIEKVGRALTSVVKSIKDPTLDKFGRFGMGFLASLGKCDVFTFTSFDHKAQQYHTWTFNCDDHLKHGKASAPLQDRSDLRNDKMSPRKGAVSVWWNSCLDLKTLIRDKQIIYFNVNEFISEHLSRFQVKLQEGKVSIGLTHIDASNKTQYDGPVEVPPFSGEPLPPYVTSYQDVFGKFELYRAPHTGNTRKGAISFRIDGNPQRILAKEVLALHGRASLENRIDAEIFDALTNGVLEGEILLSGVTLHESRKGFNQGDALTNLLICLETWHMEVGNKLVEKAQNERVDQRRQDLATRAMRALDGLFRSTPELEGLLKGFTRGNVGEGHVDLNVVGQKTGTSVSSNRGGAGTERGKGSGESGELDKPGKELTGHKPFQVGGPGGSNRKTVASRCNAGVLLSFVQLPLTGTVYEVVSHSDGLEVRINTINPNFSVCEARESDFIRYCMNVLAIAMAERAAENNPALRRFIKGLIPMMTYLITEGEKLSGLKNRRKKKPEEV